MADDIADRATLGDVLLEAAIGRWGVEDTRKLILMLSWFRAYPDDAYSPNP
jgi:hypothetical protein